MFGFSRFFSVILVCLLMCSLFVIPVVFAGDTLVDSYTDTQSYEAKIDGYYEGWGQTFTADADFVLTEVTFSLGKAGTSNAVVQVFLFALTGTYGTNAIPTGSALASSDTTIAHGDLTSTMTFYNFTFSDEYELQEGEHYGICLLQISGTTTAASYFRIGGDVSSPSHDGNFFYTSDGGSSYSGSNAIDFRFYVYGDAVSSDAAPYYSDADDDGVTTVGASVTCSVHWFDDLALDICWFSTNNTGTWVNSSLTVSGTDSWANKTFALNTTAGMVVQYLWYCSDNASQWNTTSTYSITTTDNYPYYSDAGDDGETQVDEYVDLWCHWFDDAGLDICYFSTNNTGSWVNSSLSVSGTDSWANTTILLNASLGVVQYMWYCNDTGGQWNSTSVYSITLTDVYPYYTDVGDDGVVTVGSTVTCYVRWWDNYDLDTCWFSTNNTGVWVNSSCSVSGAWSWANKTVSLNYTAGVTVQYLWYCCDNNDLWNTTSVYSIVTVGINSTFYFNNATMGSFYVGGVSRSNGTELTFDYNQSVSLMGVTSGVDYVFSSFNWTSGSSSVNPYTYYVVAVDDVWCYFAESGGSGSPESEFVFGNPFALMVAFGVFISVCIISFIYLFVRKRS